MHVYDIVSLDGGAWEMTKRIAFAVCGCGCVAKGGDWRMGWSIRESDLGCRF